MLIQAVLAVLCMAAVPVVISSISTDVYSIGVVRLLIATIGVVGWFLWKRGWPKLPLRDWLVLMGIGCVFAIHWLTYFLSVRYSTASIAAIAISTYGIHLVILGWFILKHPVTVHDILAVILAIIGVWLVEDSSVISAELMTGFLLGIFSAILYAFLPIIHQKNKHLSGSLRASGQFFFALIVFTLMAIPNAQPIPVEDWPGLLLISVVSTLIGHTLWVNATSHLPTVTSSVVYYLYVPLAMTGSYFFNKENISLPMMTGAALIIIANTYAVVMHWRMRIRP